MSGDVGVAGTRERRVAERRAIVDAYLALALGTVQARLESGWIDQAHSPLGSRVHIDAVRRRIAEGRRDALIRGRRAMLTIDALADEYFGSHETQLTLASVKRRGRAANDNGGQS